MATFSIVGVYSIAPTAHSIADAARYHQYDWSLDEQGNYTEVIDWDQHQNLALIELRIHGQFSPDELGEISQDDQAPYMEFYLDGTGTRLLTEGEAIVVQDRRVCFFLHFTDTYAPLRAGSASLALPPMSELPERLSPFAHYLPVD